MRGLFYKEVILAKPYLIFIGILQGILIAAQISLATLQNTDATAIMIINSMCTFMMYVIVVLFCQDNFFSNDEKLPWSIFVSSTPETMKGQILCKYYIIWILDLLILFVQYIVDVFTSAIFNSMEASASMAIFMMFCMTLFLQAIIIPFCVRYGSDIGKTVLGMAAAILGAAVGIYLLFGDVSILFGGNFLDIFNEFFAGVGGMWILALIPYVACICYYLSYGVSIKIYRKGMENYGG